MKCLNHAIPLAATPSGRILVWIDAEVGRWETTVPAVPPDPVQVPRLEPRGRQSQEKSHLLSVHQTEGGHDAKYTACEQHPLVPVWEVVLLSVSSF